MAVRSEVVEVAKGRTRIIQPQGDDSWKVTSIAVRGTSGDRAAAPYV